MPRSNGEKDTRAPLQRTVTAVAAGALAMTPGAALASPRSAAPTLVATQVDTPPDPGSGTVTTPPPSTTPTTIRQDDAATRPDALSPAAAASGMHPVVSTGAKDPSILSPVNGSVVELGSEVLASYDCQDDPPAPIGNFACVGTVANGTPIDTSTLGVKSFEVAFSHDILGLLGSTAVTYTVVEAATPSVAGTVTDSASALPVPEAFVAALRVADYTSAGGTVSNGGGQFQMTLPEGDYYLYLLDPAGHHQSGFFGAPTVVTVTDGVTFDADPTLVPTSGSIAGTVEDAGTNAPIAGALALAMHPVTGGPERGAMADGGGAVAIDGLSPSHRRYVALDPSGAHDIQFNGGTIDPAVSDPVTVTAGGIAHVTSLLPTRTANPGGEALTGSVTEDGTGDPLPSVFVIALDGANFSYVAADVTDGSGGYAFDLSAGDYILLFVDPTGAHDPEVHDGLPTSNIFAATPVSAPGAVDIGLAPSTGAVAGTVFDDPLGTPIQGAWVIAIGPTGAIVGAVVTDITGGYTLDGLPDGSYRFAFLDPTGAHALEYHEDSSGFVGSTPVPVTRGVTTTLDAHVAAP